MSQVGQAGEGVTHTRPVQRFRLPRDSPACREHFGNDHGRYWTASSVFNEAFVVDLGRGAVDRVAKDEAQRVRCMRR